MEKLTNLAELGWRREGFALVRDGPKAYRDMTEDSLDAKTERSEELAEREGFEPSVEFPLHTLSKRARSTTPTSLRLESITCERSGTG